jgi:hypothetical protein
VCVDSSTIIISELNIVLFLLYIQMQFFDHPKVFSIPLGPDNKDEIANILRNTPNMTNRTNLLFISNSDSETRLPITKRLYPTFMGQSPIDIMMVLLTIMNYYKCQNTFYVQAD